jgi:2-keto-4-pentenoate hydratase/2-oxohepta-3-ene-1,7-dioic acid hydratase in catechol pathway
MRWVRFERDGREGVGTLQGDRLQPVRARSLQEVIAGEGLEPSGEPFAASEATLRAPLRPGKIIAVGQNYWDHCREQNVEAPARPILFAKFPLSVIGPEEQVRWPEALSAQVDYEAELALVIGKTARGIEEAGALDYLFGYTNANDVSARDVQFGDKQWLRGKAIDTFCPLGPAIVTTDEVPDPQNLPIACRVNGVTLQDSHTREMIFPVRHLLAFISQAITLEPGDVILTGTPHGVGVFRSPQVFLKPGDRTEVEIANFGVLANTVGPFLPPMPVLTTPNTNPAARQA